MRLFFAIITIALSSALGFGQVAEFSFEAPVFKSPKINEGKQIEHYFVFTNTGKAPLIISHYEVACSCTKVFFPDYPIAPGKTDSIRVTFDSNGKYYQQDRAIILSSNAKKKETTLRLKVYVIPKED
jgi:hypothetical protein